MTTAERFFTHPVGKPLAAIGAALLWGSAFPVIKLSYTHLHIARNEIYEQMIFAGYRFTLAGLLIMALMAVLRIKWEPGVKPLAGALKVSIFQTVLQYLVFYIGIGYSTGTVSSIIAGTTSFFQLLVARFAYRNEQFTPMRVTGMLVGMSGILVIYFQGRAGGQSFGIGEILLLAAMLFGALGNVINKQQSVHYNIFYLTGVQMVVGGVVLGAFGAFHTGLLPFAADSRSVLMLAYLSFLSSSGFLLWNYLMKYNSVGSISMYLALIPLFGVVLSNLMLGEPLHTTSFVSLLLMIMGIVSVNRIQKRPG
jgi:drug/metabolite transporter (DMT)-like permease